MWGWVPCAPRVQMQLSGAKRWQSQHVIQLGAQMPQAELLGTKVTGSPLLAQTNEDTKHETNVQRVK